MSEPARTTAFALAVRSPGGGPWLYLSATALGSNLSRTTSPFHARTWDSVAEIQAWLADRGELADRMYGTLVEQAKTPAKLEKVTVEYSVVPLAIAVAPSSRTLGLRTLEARGKKAEQGEEYHLS